MFKEAIDCIDAGTEYCPCHLAESGECLLCSQLHGSHFCDCLNWKGVCIYQEYFYNGNKAREGRKTYSCRVVESSKLEEELLLIRFETTHKLAMDLLKVGSFIFIRSDENIYFDVPISIMEVDVDNNIVSVMIEVRGIKTKKLLEIKADDNIVIRGPYWNGVFGLKDLEKLVNSNTVVLSRGIGMAPMMPVIRKLSHGNNNIDLVIDKSPFNSIYVNNELEPYNLGIKEINIIDKGELSEECKGYLLEKIRDKDIKHIHLAGADILTYKIIEFLDKINREDITLSCCNNAKMCCGEGVCGSCTTRFSGHRVKRFCKFQSDPRNVFEGRRYI